MNTTKIIADICLVSREGVCMLDMKAVAEKAKQIGLLGFAELIEKDLLENKIVDGQYATALKNLYGVTS